MAAGATLMGAAACSSNDAISGTDAATDRPAVTKDAAKTGVSPSTALHSRAPAG